MKLQKFIGTFKKSLLLIITLQLMACAGVNKTMQKAEPQAEADPKVANTVSSYYFMMAETALMQGDLEMAIQLYMRADKEAPRNIFIKETIMEILEMGLKYDEEAADKIIALGEDYLKRGLISEKILNILAIVYREKKQDEKLEQILQLQIEKYPSMRGYLLHYYYVRDRYQREDKELLQAALQQEWQNINEVISITFELEDMELVAETIKKSYERWTERRVEKAEILAQLEDNQAAQVFTDLIEAALYSGEKIIEEIARYYLVALSRNEQYGRILAAAPYLTASNSGIINELIFSAAVNQQEWSLVAALGERLLTSPKVYARQYTLLNTALAEAKQADYEAALGLISSVEDWRELSFTLAYIYPKIPEPGQQIFYEQVDQVWDDADQINFVRSRFMLSAEDYLAAEELLKKLSNDFILQNELIYFIAADYLSLQKLEAAENILALHPELENTAVFIGRYYLQEAQYQKALDYLQKKIQSSAEAGEELYLISSLAAHKLQNDQLELQLLREGLRKNPESSNMLNGLGYAIADMNLTEYFSEAEQYLLRAVELQPESYMIWDSLAWLYFRQARYEEALEIMLEHCSENIEDSAIAYHFGAIYLQLQEMSAAQKYLTQTLILDNDEEAVQAAEKLLKEHFKVEIEENLQK